jgi:hypothetical protein
MKAITILRYMTDQVESLPLGVSTRLVLTHDVPILFIQLVEDKPWIRRTRGENNAQVFNGSEWNVSSSFKILHKSFIFF